MPRLMERDDVMRTAVNLGGAEEVWSEECDTESGDIGLHLPYGGSYRVIVLKVTHDSVGRTGNGHLGVHFGGFPAEVPCAGPELRQLHALDVLRDADIRVPADDGQDADLVDLRALRRLHGVSYDLGGLCRTRDQGQGS